MGVIRYVLFFVLLTSASTLTSNEQLSELERFQIAKKSAKSVLLRRDKRGFWPWERREEREEREEDREAAQRRERSRENTARLARVCPTRCWGGWGSFGACSKPCGGAGIKTQTRSVKPSSQLGECKAWVASNGCPGSNRRTAACNRFCHNKGSPTSRGCTCPAGWKDQCCGTRVTCPNPGRPVNGQVTPSGNALHYRTTVRFSCNTGYRMSGPSTRTCSGSGQWTYSVPKCNIVRCPTPTVPSNSRLTLVSGTAYIYQSSVKVTCNSGYSLSGTAIRQCQANGRWSGTNPTCARIICPQHSAPPNGKVVYSRGLILNSVATYTCNSGFFRQGAATRKCQSNRQWTGQLPTCQRILCSLIAAPPYGSVSFEGVSGGKVQFSGKAKFSCNSGYVIRGASSSVCGGTSAQGTWSAARPTCQPINCGDPGTPAYGVKSGTTYTRGGTVSFMCTAGFYLSGATSITCQNTGRWSGTKPNCLKCGANTYKTSTDAAKSCISCPAHSTTSGATGATSKNSCVCSAGYRGAPGGPCTQITCPAISTPPHATRKSCSSVFGGRCQFDCNAGHVNSKGDLIRSCGGNGVWSGNNLVCSACPKNTFKSSITQCSPCPANSGTSGVGNEKSGCRCNAGWTGPNGGPCQDVNECLSQNGGCAQQCINAVGSFRCECNLPGYIKDADDHKKCNRKNRCAEMIRPSNGGLVCYSHQSTSTERCQVTCNKGYEHVASPNAFEQCGPSTNWKWSHEISDTPILDCLESYFEEIQLELEVFYFASGCSQLTAAQKNAMKAQFRNFLISKGICKESGQNVCQIDDVTIECGSANRRKRSTTEQVKISFMLKSMVKSRTRMNNCDAACQSRVKATMRTQLMAESEKAKRMLMRQTTTNSRGRPGFNHRRPATPTMQLGGMSFIPTRVSQSQVSTSCPGNMVKSGDTCATCPSGSYKTASQDKCTLCPIRTFQPRAGQMACIPCLTAMSKGSKTCAILTRPTRPTIQRPTIQRPKKKKVPTATLR